MLESNWSKAAAIGGAAVVGGCIGYWAKGQFDKEELAQAKAEAAALKNTAAAVREQQKDAFDNLTR